MVALVQSKAAAISVGPKQVVLDAAPTEGNLLVATVTSRSGDYTGDPPAGWTVVPIDGGGTAEVDTGAVSNGGWAGMMYKWAGAGESATVSVAGWVTGSSQRLCVSEWSGLDALDGALSLTDQTASFGQSIGPFTPTSGVPALLIAMFAQASTTGTNTPGAGWTELDDGPVSGSGGPVLMTEYRIIAETAGSAYTASTTLTVEQEWCAVLAAFTGPAEPAGEPPPELPTFEEPAPAAALVEIYTADADADRWSADTSDWSSAEPYAAHWGSGGWQDVTPRSATVDIRWGATDADPGILADQAADDWRLELYDPDRDLDPANPDSPYYPELVPGLPVRVSHRGVVIRTGIAERLAYRYSDGTGLIRVTNNIARMARASVPAASILGTTLVDRCRDAIAAAGLDIESIFAGTDPSVPAEDAGEHSAWWWVRETSRDRHWIPYIDRENRLRWRPYAAPVDRGTIVTDANLVDLQAVTEDGGQVSRVRVLDDDGVTVVELAITPTPTYGNRRFVRDDIATTDAADWAAQVLDDRGEGLLRFYPGEVRGWTARDVEQFAKVETNELLTLSAAGIAALSAQVLGGRIRVAWEVRNEPVWSFWWTMTAGTSLVLVADYTGEPLVSDDDPDVYLEVG